MKFDVLILAGGEAPEGLEARTDHASKATLKLGGRFMIEYIVDAIRGAAGCGRILVVGNTDPLEKALGDRVWKVQPAKDSMFANLQQGLDAFTGSEWLLVSTCDIPLMTSEMVDRFADTCSTLQGDLFYSGIAKELFDAKYPTTKRTYARALEGVFTGGNIVIMRPDALRKNWAMIESAIAARKSPLKLVRIIGLKLVVKFLFKRLSIKDIEAKVRQLLGIDGKIVQVIDPEIGIDVDKVVDYELVTQCLEKK